MIKIIMLSLVIFLFSGCLVENTTETKKDSPIQKIPKNSVAMVAILLSYENQKIVSAEGVWSEKLFGLAEGDLNSYYMEASANNFQYKKVSEKFGDVDDGVISVSLDKNHPDADVDSAYFENRVYPDMKKALEKVDKNIDFSNYDLDANGYITPDELSIVFIMAGYEDAYEGHHVKNGIWGHQNCMNDSENVAVLDGVSLMGCKNQGNFALFGERHNKSSSYNATIGIIAHELGHATFNLPDLYNTYDPNSGGIGYFGIMGSGTWGSKTKNEHAGQTPTHFSAWSKVYTGWITPTITKSAVVLYATSSSEYNIVKIPIDDTTYYLLENRDNSGYDRGLNSLDGDFKGGMALWKIDDSKTTQQYIKDNNVNANTSHKGVDLVEAVDGFIDYRGEGGAENALFYDENVNHFSTLITNISQRGSVMGLNIN